MQAQFDSLSAFLDMGGYGFFVWLAFGVSAVAMLLLTAHSFIVKRQILKTVEQEQARAMRILQAREKRKAARKAKAEQLEEQNSNLEVESQK